MQISLLLFAKDSYRIKAIYGTPDIKIGSCLKIYLPMAGIE